MKRLLHGASFLLIGILFATNLLLSGCGSSEEATKASQAAADSLTMASLQSDNQKLQSDNAQLRKSNAQLEQDKKALTAKVADLTSKLGQSSQQWQDLEDLQNRVNALDSELTIQKQINRDLSAKNADMEKQFMTGATKQSTVTTRSEFQEKYNEGLKLFKAREYKDAVANFEDLTASEVKTDLISNAHYWLGECYYALQRYNDAVRAFERTLTYPKSYKEGAAYIMLGMSYVRLGDKDRARDTWQKLIKKDPKSQYAARAKEFLKQL
ncbi:MAG: tetratricopeptide repeat protein [Bacteroidetes bacterium]|nr:tetratricopeptide repeat protein [Bacteroidota bacterium]MCL5737353.1 tetratricopeptide repeat protein [Bacteroidota bacterium]